MKNISLIILVLFFGCEVNSVEEHRTETNIRAKSTNSTSQFVVTPSHNENLEMSSSNIESYYMDFYFRKYANNAKDGKLDIEIGLFGGQHSNLILINSINLEMVEGAMTNLITSPNDPISFEPNSVRFEYRPSDTDLREIEIESGSILFNIVNENEIAFTFDISYSISGANHTLLGSVSKIF